MPPSGDRETIAAIWNGMADSYDAYRPQMPAALLDLLPQFAHVARPSLVVDLGSGTGLSTYAWAERADAVIGVEPNDDMRTQAERKGASQGSLAHVSFRASFSHETGLADSSADIVTASQALHWMDLDRTFAEVARILRPGGVFAVYDYEWPPVIIPELDQLYSDFKQVLDPLFAALSFDVMLGLGHPKDQHLARIQQSGAFHFSREFGMHSVEMGDADRYLGLMLSNSAAILLQRGLVTEDQVQLDTFRTRIEALFAGATLPWYITYQVRLAVK